jgi:hypothetical protein
MKKLISYTNITLIIPKNWKKRIKESSKKLMVVTISRVQKLKQLRKPSKQLYLDFIQSIVSIPSKAQQKWEIILNDHVCENDWKMYYILPLKATIETKLRTFQLKKELAI